MEYTELTPFFHFDQEKFNEKFYTTPAFDKDNNKFILKIRIEDYPETKETFGWERFFVRYFNEIDTKNLYTAEFIKSGELPPEWMIYKYVEGKAAGNMCEINKNIVSEFPIEKVVKSIISLQNLTKNAIIRKEIKTLPDKNKTQSYSVLVHGDFHPGNIIIQKNKVVIIDWAYIHLNNYLYDIAFLWLLLWNHSELQNKLLKTFKKLSPIKDSFEEIFNLNIKEITPKMFRIVKDRMAHDKNYTKEHLEYLKNIKR